METQGARGLGAEPEPPPGLSKGDQYLFREMGREIGQVRADMSEIVKAVSALPAGVDQRIEPLNSRLTALDQAVRSLSDLSGDVQQIREEFTGFRSFRERIEEREKLIEGSLKKLAVWMVGGLIGAIVATLGVIGTVGLTGYHIGSTMKGIDANVYQAQKDVGEIKGSVEKLRGEMRGDVEKLQAATYDLNGNLKSQGERLKGMDEQLRAVQVSVREAPARTAAETSDKTAERIAGELQAFKKSTEDLAGRFNAFERKVEEASDVLVLWLALNPGDKPVGGSDTTLHYYPPVPPQQKQKVLHAGRSRSKTLLSGVVNFYEGDELLRQPGLIAATAQPMKDEGRIPINLFFQDKAAREGFEKVMERLREDRKPMRLKVTFTLE